MMDSLIKHGKVVRGYLGVRIEDIDNPAKEDEALAKSIKKSGFSGKGVLVPAVKESPAAKGRAGGDVITAINGKGVESRDQLVEPDCADGRRDEVLRLSTASTEDDG